jgi:hypothetical protein
MSGIDKFVLLPHERYERLIKKGSFETEEEAKEKKEEEEENDINHKLTDNISPQFQKEEQQKHQQEQKEKVPFRPPGLAKVKPKPTLKWYSLFNQ